MPISLITPLKLQEIIDPVEEMLIKTNPDYNIVIKRLHLYYNMKLVTFRIDRKRNLIIQFPIFLQPYTQQPLILYQLEAVPELFVVRHKPIHSCKSAIYFDLDKDIIKRNCNFMFYYNKTGITLTVLDGGSKIILANWPNDKNTICTINNDILIDQFNLTEELQFPILANKTTSEFTLPVFLNSSKFDDSLLTTPQMF